MTIKVSRRERCRQADSLRNGRTIFTISTRPTDICRPSIFLFVLLIWDCPTLSVSLCPTLSPLFVLLLVPCLYRCSPSRCPTLSRINVLLLVPSVYIALDPLFPCPILDLFNYLLLLLCLSLYLVFVLSSSCALNFCSFWSHCIPFYQLVVSCSVTLSFYYLLVAYFLSHICKFALRCLSFCLSSVDVSAGRATSIVGRSRFEWLSDPDRRPILI